MQPSLNDSYEEHIWHAIRTINSTYRSYQSFLHALIDLAGRHGIEDISVAQEAISNITDETASILHLSVIVHTEEGIDTADAQSRVTQALDDYVTEEAHRVTYRFRAPGEYHAPDGSRTSARTSIRALGRYPAPERTATDPLEALEEPERDLARLL